MAIIPLTQNKADVQALGTVMSATVNFSGALMEMLATVYVYILMAAAREAVQNACDAARRAGLTFANGVKVALPTPSNPVISVTDKGAGMTKEFMETTYLSFGSSTKAGDDGSAGGLGVGRWAAYGYIRECYITTCHASDRVARTYFQFQGENGTPQVQLASEVTNGEVGTTVTFPVKEADIPEALRAVAWLKSVMQLTMGDSFSVDAPALLPKLEFDFCGTLFELGEVDESLKGVRIFPMKTQALQYRREGLAPGSLVVLTNQEQGVGGLPFHVQRADVLSVFSQGMVIEIPMSFGIPFMPSREEIKYTDEVNKLMERIDSAFKVVAVRQVKALYASKLLSDKTMLTTLVSTSGSEVRPHCLAHAMHNKCDFGDALIMETGRRPWTGQIVVNRPDGFSTDPNLQLRFALPGETTLRTVHKSHAFSYSAGKARSEYVKFRASLLLTLVINDCETAGTQRFRDYLDGRTKDQRTGYLFFSAKTAAEAEEAATLVNAQFNGDLPILRTSSFPEVVRTVVGTKVVASVKRSAASLVKYDLVHERQETVSMAFSMYRKDLKPRVYLERTAKGGFEGFRADANLNSILKLYRSLTPAIKYLQAELYILTSKQAAALREEVEALKAEVSWDALQEELDPATWEAVQALKSWQPVEEALASLIDHPEIQSFFKGETFFRVTEYYGMAQFCNALAKAPRFCLTGTSFDKAFQPHVDLVSCEVKLKKIPIPEVQKMATMNLMAEGLAHLAKSQFARSADDTPERKALLEDLVKLEEAGHVNYGKIWTDLVKRFPLLEALNLHSVKGSIDHLCLALGYLYR